MGRVGGFEFSFHKNFCIFLSLLNRRQQSAVLNGLKAEGFFLFNHTEQVVVRPGDAAAPLDAVNCINNRVKCVFVA